MENITAVFSSQSAMETAIHALKEQGVVDIVVQSEGGDPDNGADAAMTNVLNDTDESVAGFVMQVVVESSRLRHAEDTIAGYGGVTASAGMQG